MNVNEMLGKLGKEMPVTPREERIREVVEAARALCCQQERPASYWEFLWSQLAFTRKRWWALQGTLLLLAGLVIPAMEVDLHQVRSTGVVGCLFVVLMIPELWRNRETDSTQIEAACLYSLRQVYAARITLFGIVDVGLLSVFCFAMGNRGFTLVEMTAQFLLPAAVTACICFWILCAKQNWSESFSIAACLTWCGIWWLMLLNESAYNAVAPAVWMALFGIALAMLILAVRETVRSTNQYWEVEFV